MCVCSVMSNSLQPHGLQPTGLLCPWAFPGKSTGVGCDCLLHPFAMQKLLSLIRFRLFIFVLLSITLGDGSKNIVL